MGHIGISNYFMAYALKNERNQIDFCYTKYTIQQPNMVVQPSNPAMVPSTAKARSFRHGDRVAGATIGLTAADAATLLGISESHFYCLHKTGRLGPLPVRMGRAVRWSRQEVIDWFNAGSPPRRRWQGMRQSGSANN
jgi:predicted DNA-binding transcriptional regulator AlpA